MKTCGNCKWYRKYTEGHDGWCFVAIPAWVSDKVGGITFKDKCFHVDEAAIMADRCDTFEHKATG